MANRKQKTSLQLLVTGMRLLVRFDIISSYAEVFKRERSPTCPLVLLVKICTRSSIIMCALVLISLGAQ